MMTLFGVLIVVVYSAVVFVNLFSSMNSYKLFEFSWMYLLLHETVNVIVLLGCALVGAWIIRRKRRLRAYEQ